VQPHPRDERLIRIQGVAVKGQHCNVTALFVCDHLKINTPLKFILDTGSVHTTLPESTANNLGIDLSKLESQKVSITGIGGSPQGYRLAGVRLIFNATDGKPIEEKLPFIIIMKTPPPRNEQERKAMETVPNLLGLDVIRRFKIRFERHMAYLERESEIFEE
jgi:hypothetical protein